MKWRWLLLFGLAFGTPWSALSQDDRPWWRQLFGQQSPESGATAPNPKQEEVPDTPPVLDFPAADEAPESEPAEGIDAEWPVDSAAPMGGVQGSVHWSIPEGIQALDSAKAAAKDIRIPGFRVQLFMGRLDSARSLRQSLLEEEGWTWPVFVTPYPPLFGVTLGNFTERLPAIRAKEALRSRFPTCLVVPLDLPLDEVYPSGAVEVQGP